MRKTCVSIYDCKEQNTYKRTRFNELIKYRFSWKLKTCDNLIEVFLLHIFKKKITEETASTLGHKDLLQYHLPQSLC